MGIVIPSMNMLFNVLLPFHAILVIAYVAIRPAIRQMTMVATATRTLLEKHFSIPPFAKKCLTAGFPVFLPNWKTLA